MDNSLAQISAGFYERPAILDIGPSGNGGGADAELALLRQPSAGFRNWAIFLEDKPQFIPTLQILDATARQVVRQAERLLELERGLVIRLKRSGGWQANLPDVLNRVEFEDAPVLILLDVGQIPVGADISVIAAEVSAVAENIRQSVDAEDLTFCVAGSSFPSAFTSIDRHTARIDIRERHLQVVLNDNEERRGSGLNFAYGDHASVFVGMREFARGGQAIRIDYPTQRRWIYHRREEENPAVEAAQAIIAEPEWDDELQLWGMERIRRAAAGHLDGMLYQQNWTAVRIQLHLHQQLHYGADRPGFLFTDEPWHD